MSKLHAGRVARTWKLCADCGRPYLGTARSVCDSPICASARNRKYQNASRARKKEAENGHDSA